MNVAPLTLVPFTPTQAHAAVRSVLVRLGYDPRVLSPAEVRGGAMADWPGTVVLLLGGAPGSREQVLSVMECVRTRPSLAVLIGGEAGWDPDLLGRCGDCARWPCDGGELAFRLGRLLPVSAPPSNAVPDLELSDILAELNLIGRSPAFLEAMGQVRRLVRCDAPVLIEGETGTGKELVARAIHYLGARASGPFVPVNCGALPDHLVENELFGHERGAYTDAKAAATGAIGEAAGGTLFLDELEALSPKAQATLLRFLQDREYRPLGSQRARRSDARVVAASNADLRTLAERREFRPDLFFRLGILSISLPPLRQRLGDLEVLSEHFIDLFCRQYGLGPMSLDPRTLPALRAYPWPGNVRELENLIHRSVLLAEGPRLLLRPGSSLRGGGHPAPESDGDAPAGGLAEAKAQAIAAFERAYLQRLMDETKGNVTQAARIAAKERRALGKLLKKYAIPSRNPD